MIQNKEKVYTNIDHITNKEVYLMNDTLMLNKLSN